MKEKSVRTVLITHIVLAVLFLIPFFIMVGIGYNCTVDGKLNEYGVTKDNSEETDRRRRDAMDELINSDAIDSEESTLASDVTESNNPAVEPLKRPQPDARRGGGGSRTRYSSSGKVKENACRSTFICFIVVGVLFGLVSSFFVLFGIMSKDSSVFERVSLIALCFDIAVWFTCFGVLLFISNWDEDGKRKVPAILTSVFCAIAISVRTVMVFIWCAIYYAQRDNMVDVI